jgi:hypothetical protein
MTLDRAATPEALGSPLEEALRLASNGLPVFPCQADKKPHTRHGFKDATTDEAQIRTWWKVYPDAMIGMPTGKASGICVLDLDMDKETGEPVGEETARERDLFKNDAPGARTPSGGRHVYLHHVEGVKLSAGKVGRCIDVRGEGAYVCVPGSGGYQWIGPGGWVPTGISEMLPALRQALGLGVTLLEHRSNAWALAALDAEIEKVRSAGEGQRNDTLNAAAFALGQIIGGGALNRTAVEGDLLAAAIACGLEDEESRKTITSGLSSGLKEPRRAEDGDGSTAKMRAVTGDLGRVFVVNPLPPAEPVPLMRQEEPSGEFPIEALGPLRAAAQAAQDISQAPMALAAQSALAVASLAAQALADVETLSGQSTPLSLFCLSIAKSGERKSSVDRLLMAPVREVEREFAKEYQEDRVSWQNKFDIYSARRGAILAKGKKGGVEAAVDLDALGPQPEGPLMPHLVASEPTFEGITKHLGMSRPAIGIFSDEGGGFLGGNAMSADNRLKTMAGLSGMWDGTPVNRTRAGDGVSTFYGRRLCCHLMVQPIAAEEFLGDPLANGQGFLARFLVVKPESAIGTRLRHGHKPASEDTLVVWGGRIREILTAPMTLSEGTRNELDPPVLQLSAEARDLLQVFADGVEIGQIKGGPLEAIQPFASKAAEQTARIAGVMTVFANTAAREISPETMADAIKLMIFYVNEALRITNGAAISREARLADELRGWLNEKWHEDCVSAADVAQFGPGAMRETAKARRLLQYLERFGHLEALAGGAVIMDKQRREAWIVKRSAVA